MKNILPLLLLSGCSMMIDGHSKVEGWPQLRVVEHFVPDAEMRERCGHGVPWYGSPIACAELRFSSSECHIIHSKDFPPEEAIRMHEIWHCLGYSHPGDDSMAKYLARWLAR